VLSLKIKTADMDITIQSMALFAGTGALWGLVITSVPYSFLMHRYKLQEVDVLECAICTGSWIALMLSLREGFHPLAFASTPLAAEMISRWIRKS
jgi:hypothetical protein